MSDDLLESVSEVKWCGGQGGELHSSSNAVYNSKCSACLRLVLEHVRAAERERCAKAVCQWCSQGLPAVDVDGDLMHEIPGAHNVNPATGKQFMDTCEAAPIRALNRC